VKLSNKKVIVELADFINSKIQDNGFYNVEDIDKPFIAWAIAQFAVQKLQKQADELSFY
jgi:hypothetical protein